MSDHTQPAPHADRDHSEEPERGSWADHAIIALGGITPRTMIDRVTGKPATIYTPPEDVVHLLDPEPGPAPRGDVGTSRGSGARESGEHTRVVDAIERGIHADRDRSAEPKRADAKHTEDCEEWCNHCDVCGTPILYGSLCHDHQRRYEPYWPVNVAETARTAAQEATGHTETGEALRGSENGCGHTVVDRDGNEGPCDRPVSDWRWYEDGGDGPLLARVCSLHGNAGGREIEALRAERDSLRAALDDRNRLWGNRSRELGDLRAEVEHWKHHAWEAGEGFKRAIEDAARAGARRRAAEAERDRLAGVVERVRAALVEEQHARCAYGTRHGDGMPCDCKFRRSGRRVTSESTGCAEMRALINLLDADATEASEEGHRG